MKIEYASVVKDVKETGLQGTCTWSSIYFTPFPGKSPSMFPPFFRWFQLQKISIQPRFSMMSQPIRKPGIPHGFDRPDKTMEFGRPTLVGAVSPSMAPYILSFKNQASTNYWYFKSPTQLPTKTHEFKLWPSFMCQPLWDLGCQSTHLRKGWASLGILEAIRWFDPTPSGWKRLLETMPPCQHFWGFTQTPNKPETGIAPCEYSWG